MFSAFFTCRCVNRESLLQPSVYYLQIQSKFDPILNPILYPRFNPKLHNEAQKKGFSKKILEKNCEKFGELKYTL